MYSILRNFILDIKEKRIDSLYVIIYLSIYSVINRVSIHPHLVEKDKSCANTPLHSLKILDSTGKSEMVALLFPVEPEIPEAGPEDPYITMPSVSL